MKSMLELRQRAEYTYKFNIKAGRYGWLRLTPAYSLQIVEELMTAHPHARRVLDPFCGTGTTALCGAYHGRSCVTLDINPFLVWLTTAKTTWYAQEDIAGTLEAGVQALALVAHKTVEPYPLPPLSHLQRWWDEEALLFLRRLRAAIDEVAPSRSAVHTLLLVAFCRTLMTLSNADFNHQSVSFKPDGQLKLELAPTYADVFWADVRFVVTGAQENPSTIPTVVLGDARTVDRFVEGPFDLVITSPPYANRMSYIRELRPYMFWLGFLQDGREAGELDWLAIGGTWGIATSRLASWERPADHYRNADLDALLERIAGVEKRHGSLLARYVAKYFDDIWLHLSRLPGLLARGAEVHYIVGNSSFYGILVPTESFYADMFRALGFVDVTCRPLRKRNSKKELIEFDVTARWL